MVLILIVDLFFFFNDTATTEIYTLSLHDALPISLSICGCRRVFAGLRTFGTAGFTSDTALILPLVMISIFAARSEEHTSELQSRQYLVCRLLLEKKKYRRSYTVCGVSF